MASSPGPVAEGEAVQVFSSVLLFFTVLIMKGLHF